MKISTQKVLSSIFGKVGIISSMAICLALFDSNTQAQTLLVNYDFASAVVGTPCTATPLTTAANVTSIFTIGGTDGDSCTTISGAPAGFYAFVENDDRTQAIGLNSRAMDAANYFQIQLANVSSYRDYKLHFQLNQSGTVEVQYSLDGTNFTTFKQIHKPVIAQRFIPFLIDLSSVNDIEGQSTVYFRLVGKSNYNPGLNFEIDNFQAQATAATKSRKRVRFF